MVARIGAGKGLRRPNAYEVPSRSSIPRTCMTVTVAITERFYLEAVRAGVRACVDAPLPVVH